MVLLVLICLGSGSSGQFEISLLFLMKSWTAMNFPLSSPFVASLDVERLCVHYHRSGLAHSTTALCHFEFPWCLFMLGIFSCTCLPSEFPLQINVYSILLSTFQSGDFLCMCGMVISVYICMILILCQGYHLQIFPPI